MPGLSDKKFAFKIVWGEIEAYYAAASRGRARYLAAKDIAEAGYGGAGKILCALRCTRALWKDLEAERLLDEGPILTDHG